MLLKVPMGCVISHRLDGRTQRAALSTLFLFGFMNLALAQSPPPPLDIPAPAPLTADPETIAWNGWLLYPELGLRGVWSDNLFQSPFNPIDATGYSFEPKLLAKWTNGIHSTTLYGGMVRTIYPGQNSLNTSDRRAGFIQQYEPLRDLKFSVQADYDHRTNTSSFINGIPRALDQPGAPPPPTPALNVTDHTVARNPADTFTATTTVEKLLNRGIIRLAGSVARTEYEETPSRDFTVKNFNGSVAHWLGPVFYAFSDGTFASYDDSNVYRALAGIGTRQFGLFSASGYFGHQETEVTSTGKSGTSGSAGGAIFGGRLFYFPTPDLTVSLGVDETINDSSITSSRLALDQPVQSSLVIPVTDSTRVTAASLQISKIISQQWAIFPRFGMTHVDYIDSRRYSDAWFADVVLNYQMTRKLTLSWEYQFTAIDSNIPLTSSERHYFETNATYKF